MKLTIELVPSSSWGNNLRSALPKAKWDKLRRKCYEEAGYVCEVCGGVGPRHPVECHEIWEYNDHTGVQKLVGVIALDPMCHRVKHIGHALSIGLGARTVAHMAKVNEITVAEAWDYVDSALRKWQNRSRFPWEVDISFVDDYIQD